MYSNSQQGLIEIQHLTQEQLAEVEALVSACRDYEGLDGALHLEPPRPVPGNETNQCLYYEDGALHGIVTLPPDNHIEVLGMVHPNRRRRGIGRALLDAAKTECRRRGVQTFLLVCEATSPAGKAFAETMGGCYRFSEHRMELYPTAFTLSPPSAQSITLRRADARDFDILVRLCSTSFDDPDERRREQVTTWLSEPNQRFYIGQLGEQVIGILRAAFFDKTIYLNTFSIQPAFRGRGFGRQVLEGVVRDLLAESKAVRIEVETDNDRALSLYHSCGFKPIITYLYYELQA